LIVLSQADVAAVLDMTRLIEVVQAAMTDLSAGSTSMPPRVAAFVAERGGLLGAMPAFLPSGNALTTKLVSVFPENTDRPTHQAVICCFDPTNGSPIALMDGTLITAMRTAAGSAVATRMLARPGAGRVAIVGTGVQSGTHAQAMRALGFDDIVVAGRSTPTSIEDAVSSADIVCLTTHAADPVICREWLRPGTHVNSVGYNSQGSGEVDRATVEDSYVVVESRGSALAPPPAGAVELWEGLDVAEVGEIVAGNAPGRSSDDQLTLYKSVGVAVQDAAAAALVLAEARTRNLGTEVDL
jgi:ornithine cyclodeaminase